MAHIALILDFGYFVGSYGRHVEARRIVSAYEGMGRLEK